MKKIFFILLIALNAVYAQGDFYKSQNLVINIDVSSGAKIIPKSSDYNVKYINVNLSHYPHDSFNQKVINFDFTPAAKQENNALLFNWQNPESKISFGYSTKIRTNNNIVKVKDKIPFPLQNIPRELIQFTKPQEIINSDSKEIIRLASKLAEGEDDLYVVVHKLAEWTKNNIDYNLSTLTAEVSQPASWVLANRQGVCDELTSLFIAMLRSVGIPAKFISGVAYTNSPLFPENWGSHGWTEVYFPGYGWVPYDVTYGQFGYIDPTHVKLKESFDSAEPSIRYKWLSSNIDLETEELDIDASVVDIVGRATEPLRLDINVIKSQIGFGSYNLVEVIIENLKDHYITSEIYLSKPKEVELTGKYIKDVLLKPKEKKSSFWIVKLTDNLQDNFIYTFPITVSTPRNLSKTTTFTSTKNEVVYSFNEVDAILQQKKEEEEKIYSKRVDINCTIDKKEFYLYENNLVQCKISNEGNVYLENLDLCLKEECKNFDLGITQEKSISFPVENLTAGKKDLILKLKNKDVSKAAYVEIDALDTPNLKIKDVKNPTEVSYDERYKISFVLSKLSRSTPQKVEVTIKQNNFKKTWVVQELFEDRKFVINLQGKNLRKGLNEFGIDVKFHDKNGRTYDAKASSTVELTNVTFLQSILLAFNNIIIFLENLRPRSLVTIIAAATLIFFGILFMIFRRK